MNPDLKPETVGVHFRITYYWHVDVYSGETQPSFLCLFYELSVNSILFLSTGVAEFHPEERGLGLHRACERGQVII